MTETKARLLIVDDDVKLVEALLGKAG